MDRFTSSNIQNRRSSLHPNTTLSASSSTIPRRETTNVSALTWQNQDLLTERREMIHRLMTMMQHRSSLMIPRSTWSERLPNLVRRIELSLFVRADSFEEYNNVYTLKRRVQSLVIALHRQGLHAKAVRRRHSTTALLQSKKSERKPPSFQPLDARSTLYASQQWKSDTLSLMASENLRQSVAQQFFATYDDITAKIFAFLPCRETIVNGRLINASLSRSLVEAVSTLDITLTQLAAAIDSRQLTLYRHIHTLRVCNTNAVASDALVSTIKVSFPESLVADNCAQVPFSSMNEGETLISVLASMLQARCFPYLHSLFLCSNFVNTEHGSAIESLMSALSTGCVPELRHLGLGGNSIGDAGVRAVCQFLSSRACPKLRHLDLRRNFIGDAGTKDICRSADGMYEFQYLCFGGNIITDHGASVIVDSIRAGAFGRKLRFVGLEHNFLEASSVRECAKIIRQGHCPMLEEICLGENAISNQKIQSIFKSLMVQLPDKKHGSAATATTTAPAAMGSGNQPTATAA